MLSCTISYIAFAPKNGVLRDTTFLRRYAWNYYNFPLSVILILVKKCRMVGHMHTRTFITMHLRYNLCHTQTSIQRELQKQHMSLISGNPDFLASKPFLFWAPHRIWTKMFIFHMDLFMHQSYRIFLLVPME